MQAALEAVSSDSERGTRTVIARRLEELPQLRQHLMAAVATGLLAEAAAGAPPESFQVRTHQCCAAGLHCPGFSQPGLHKRTLRGLHILLLNGHRCICRNHCLPGRIDPVGETRP